MFGARPILNLIALASLLLAAPALASGPLTSAVTAAGSLSGPSFAESWTFDATSGDRVILVAVTTSGSVNTVFEVHAPGGALISNTASDRIDLQASSTGTFSVTITDQGLNDPGTYNITFLNVTAGPLTHAGDLDGGTIGSGAVVAGTIGLVADLDAFTFTGTAGQRVLFGQVEGSALPFNVGYTLYPPGGGGAELAAVGGNRLDTQLQSTGTYTVVIEDLANDHTGAYTATFLDVTNGPHTTIADPDGGAVISAESATGTIDGVIDWDAFTFSATAGDRIAVVALTTGGTLNTTAYLYPPGGGGTLVSTSADRWDVQVQATGTFTLVLEDQSFGESGTYQIRVLNLTSGPLTSGGDPDGGPIGSGEVFAGSLTLTDLDAFTFAGTAGQRVIVGVLEGAIAPFNVGLTLYPPGGGGAETATSGGNRLDTQLSATGTYTVVVEDLANDHTGNYTLTFLNVTGGPHTTGPDPDGGALLSSVSTTGSVNGVLDFDAFTFNATNGDRIAVVALSTGGALNTMSTLYPPNGGTAIVSTTADRWDVKLTQTGTWTLVIEDQSFGDTGSYRLSMLNLTAGPLTHAGDLDGGPIVSGDVQGVTIGEQTDLDAFTFAGVAGERVLFGVLESAAPPFNTTLTLYPPDGGPAEAATAGGNRMDHQLVATGTYTVVVEDVLNDHTGPCLVTFLNVTSGPHTAVVDPDGAPLPSATRATGAMNTPIDWDAFTFDATAGDRIAVACITTLGSLNTTTYLYPPGGGATLTSTAADRWDLQLNQTGTYTLVIEDQAFGHTGDYAVTHLNLTSGPYTHAGDADGGPLGSDEQVAGHLGAAPDIDAYTFTGTAGDRIVAGGVALTGAPFNTTMTLYPPGGGTAAVASSGGDRIDHQLLATGTYTLVIEDVGDDTAGDFGLRFVNLTAGPVTSGSDPDGGPFGAGDTHNGTIGPLPDFDVFWFNAQPGDTARVSCVTTGGALNTTTFLYPPGGGSAVVTTSGDVWSHAIQSSGQYALLVQHLDLTQTGTYLLGLTGPLTTVDVPGPEPRIPDRLAFSAARPNPSHSLAAFALELPRRESVQIRVYDARGALVRVVEDRAFEPGVHTVVWDGADIQGRRVASGVYFVRVVAGGESFTRRIVRMR